MKTVIADVQVNGHQIHIHVEVQPDADPTKVVKDIVEHVKNVEANPTPEKRYNEWLR